MSKDIKVGNIVRVTDGIGKGQSVMVQDLIELPFGTGVVVDLDGGYRETLNPANVEVIETGSPEDLLQRITALEDQQATLLRSHSYHFNRVDGCIGDLTRRMDVAEEAMRRHEKNVHEPIRERLADLESTLFKHLEKIYDRLEAPAPDKSNNDVTTENVATRDSMTNVWRIYDKYRDQGGKLQANYFLLGAAVAMGTTVQRLRQQRLTDPADTTDKAEPHLPTPERRDPRIDGPLGDAYARYDSDDRVNGPDDFTAFADAVETHARYLLRDELERFISFAVLEGGDHGSE